MPTSKKPITKNQIVTHFAEKFELSKKTASSIIDEMAMLATNETKKTGVFTFPGIGKLVLVKRKARVGRNPATGEQINIPAKTVVKMRVAKACRQDCGEDAHCQGLQGCNRSSEEVIRCYRKCLNGGQSRNEFYSERHYPNTLWEGSLRNIKPVRNPEEVNDGGKNHRRK